MPFDNGGPDAFGYRWEDNDNGGAPVYNWVDITSIGTRVNGLSDDNYVGPFQFGFQFPYYWYMADHCWIGSNGYINFSYAYNFAHPFSAVPSPDTMPHDLVCALTGDLDITQGGSCYYYSNNVDTFIVSWIDVPPFSNPPVLNDSTHTFQLILTSRDSSITFQYGENHGRFSEQGNLQDVIGIENVNGRVGLPYLVDNLPSARLWHDGLVVKFHPIPNPNFVVHDFGVRENMNETSGAVFVHNNATMTPRVLVKNFGNRAESNLIVNCQIRRTTVVYNITDTIPSLEPAQEMWLEFPTYTPTTIGTYRITFVTTLAGDEVGINNTKTSQMEVYSLPTRLRYDDGTPGGTGRSWNGDFSGFANEFVVPEPVRIDSIGFHVEGVVDSMPWSFPAVVWIVPDSSGQPQVSNIIAGDTVMVDTTNIGAWKNVDFTWADLVFNVNEKFYVVVIHQFQSTFTFSMDTSVPLSFRGWEYTGGLGPDRDRSVSDIMINAYADTATATGVDETPVPKAFSLAQNYPNPFNAQTTIKFSLRNESDVRLNIYNITGQLVEVISGHFAAGNNSVIWDASKAASGVYFYKMSVGDITETRKMVLVK
jgi:hypothetical protein